MLVAQYLEPGHETASVGAAQARARLREAFGHLPIDAVILGWDLPASLMRACVDETRRANARLFRWHPLLTGSGALIPRAGWQAVGLDGEHVHGFQGLPEFTFVCPNHPAAAQAALENLRRALKEGTYDGVFLDRIRYPSPSADPGRLLACFCAHCQRTAEDEGLDLADASRRIRVLLEAPSRLEHALRLLLAASFDANDDPDQSALQRFLAFRVRSIARLVRAAAGVARSEGCEVALDCFAPSLTHMVGQDLRALNRCCSWIKVMTYGHTFAPAGLPFELLGLARWAVGRGATDGGKALAFLGGATQLALPPNLGMLAEEGLSSQALAAEVRRGREMGVERLLAGVELVDAPGVTRLNLSQIAADLQAFREAGADGLVLSWDLWRIPLDRLEIVRSAWLAPSAA